MKLKYVGPHDEVEVAGVHIVKRGEVFECDAALAGRSHSTTKDDKGNDVIFPGSGLLAQPDNFQLVNAPKTKEA